MTFAQKLSRLAAGTSAETIAREVGCHGVTVRRFLKGEQTPRLPLAAALATHFDVPLDWLADDEADWPPPENERQQVASLIREALAGAGLAGELSEQEREVIAAMRALSEKDASELAAMVHGYVLGAIEARREGEAGGDPARLYRLVRRRLEEADQAGGLNPDEPPKNRPGPSAARGDSGRSTGKSSG